MGNTAQQVAKMVEMLPESDQKLAYELIKKLVIAWDPDYTRVTPTEAQQLEEAEKAFARGEYVTQEEIDWE